MKDIGLKMGAVPSIDVLNYLSDINKRKDYSLKLKKFLNNELSGDDLKIDWSKAGRDYDLIPWADGISYLERWNEIHLENEHYKGKKIDPGFIAFEVIVGYQKELNLDITKWGRIQYDWFCTEFGEENLVSAMLHLDSEEYPHCHFIIYHTDSDGKLSPVPYINADGSINEDFLNRYETDMAGFGLDRKKRLELAEQSKTDLTASEDFYLATIDRYISKNPRSALDDKEFVYDIKSQLAEAAGALSFERQEEILDSLLDTFNGTEKRTMKNAQTGKIEKEDFFKLVKIQLKKLGIEKSDEVDIMLKRIDSAVYGNYVLDPLLNDDSISDIKVIAPDKIRVKRYGRRMTSNLSFRGINDYWRFLNGIAIRNHTDLSPFNAVQNFTDKTSNDKAIMRVNICTNFVNSVPYPYFHIRKVKKEKYELEDLINFGMMDMKTASYLLDKVKNARGILFTGKGASGKTTLMNTLLDLISYNNSGLVIQENEELFSKKHPDLMFQHIVTSRRQGEIQYDLKDLARNGLLTDLDYFVIGEIKGGEALYFLNAAYTGHKCWASCHGASSTEAMNKLADYVKYESDYSKEDALKMLQSMEVVIFMKNFKVAEIAEVVGWDEEKKDLKYNLIYRGAA